MAGGLADSGPELARTGGGGGGGGGGGVECSGFLEDFDTGDLHRSHFFCITSETLVFSKLRSVEDTLESDLPVLSEDLSLLGL